MWQSREISSQSGHSGQNSLVAHFGLGDADVIDSLRVVWPSGRVQVLTALMANKQIVVTEPSFTRVEGVFFTAKVVENETVLTWKTALSPQYYGFEIERKSKKEDWKNIGFVPTQRPTTETNEYTFADESLNEAGIYDYRIKILKGDGQYEHSTSVQVYYGLPMTFELNQNFPNPFNPSTLIRYALPREEWVRLDVYDVLGRFVTTIVNQRQTVGYHEVTFNSFEAADGIYFYRLTAGTFCQQKKMILVR